MDPDTHVPPPPPIGCPLGCGWCGSWGGYFMGLGANSHLELADFVLVDRPLELVGAELAPGAQVGREREV